LVQGLLLISGATARTLFFALAARPQQYFHVAVSVPTASKCMLKKTPTTFTFERHAWQPKIELVLRRRHHRPDARRSSSSAATIDRTLVVIP
jgi:hypothetical protein